jgi:hypothetical protein
MPDRHPREHLNARTPLAQRKKVPTWPHVGVGYCLLRAMHLTATRKAKKDMHFALEGSESGDEDNPFMVITSVLDRPYMQGPVKKERREDLQLSSAIHAIALVGMGRHPLGVRIGEDPPDRYLVHGGRVWGTELTELTVEDVRRDLGILRQFGRELERRILDRMSDFSHLHGRMVTLGKLPGTSLPKDPKIAEQLFSDLEVVLSEDRGFFGEDMQAPSDTGPNHLGSRGLYGHHGPFDVIVNGGSGGVVYVSATQEIRIDRSEAIAALARSIAVKGDESKNEILIITCGMPNPQGYVCEADQALFHMIREARLAGVPIIPEKPTHIKGILLHLWNTRFFCHFSLSDDVPWITGKAPSAAS